MVLLVGSIGLACASCVTTDPAAPVLRTVQVSRPVPEVARQPCADPVALPDRRITAQETTDLWAEDRSALRECEKRRRAAVEGTD